MANEKDPTDAEKECLKRIAFWKDIGEKFAAGVIGEIGARVFTEILYELNIQQRERSLSWHLSQLMVDIQRIIHEGFDQETKRQIAEEAASLEDAVTHYQIVNRELLEGDPKSVNESEVLGIDRLELATHFALRIVPRITMRGALGQDLVHPVFLAEASVLKERARIWGRTERDVMLDRIHNDYRPYVQSVIRYWRNEAYNHIATHAIGPQFQWKGVVFVQHHLHNKMRQIGGIGEFVVPSHESIAQVFSDDWKPPLRETLNDETFRNRADAYTHANQRKIEIMQSVIDLATEHMRPLTQSLDRAEQEFSQM